MGQPAFSPLAESGSLWGSSALSAAGIGRLGLRHTLAGGIVIGAVCRSGCILLGLQGFVQGSLGLVQLVLGIRKGLSVLLCLFSSLSGFVRHSTVQ